MCTGWCPLAAEWGNVAEVVSALAAVLVGLGAWVLAAKTHKLVRAANKTTEKLADIEAKRYIKDEALRNNEEQLLLIGIAAQFGQCEVILHRLDSYVSQEDAFDLIIDAPNDRELIVQDLSEATASTRLPETTRSRLHNLASSVSGRVIRLEATIPVLRSIFAGIRRTTPDYDGKEFITLKELIEASLLECRELRQLGLNAAHESGMPMPRAPDAKPADA